MDKEVIAVGEASHGASEFFRMKSEIFKHLVREGNVRVFCLESTFTTAFHLNKYLLDETESPKEAIGKLDNFFWNTEEVLELVQWIKNWNRLNPKDLVYFFGIDVNSIQPSAELISKYIYECNLINNRRTKAYYKELLISNSEESQVLIDSIKKELLHKKSSYIKQSSKWEYDFLTYSLINLTQAKNYRYRKAKVSRDEYLAINVKWVKQYTGKKIFVWAHNNHVSKYYGYMGHYLDKAYGDAFYAIGFDFSHGKFWAKKGSNLLSVKLNGNKFSVCTATPPKEKFLTYKFSSLGSSLFFLDLKTSSTKSKELKKIFSKTMKVHNTTEWFSKKTEYQKTVLNQAYDAIIYIEEITPSKHFVLRNNE